MSDDELEKALGETKRAAKDLARAATRLTKRLLTKAEAAAKDPPHSAARVSRRVAKELDAASREIDRILRDL
ncbi:MAG: hypothetical protein ACLQD8_00635 [Thermoplasmata archaeon]